MSSSSDRLPTCSVIIATLNRVDSLRRTLICLGRQTQAPLEILIAASGDVPSVERLVQEFHPRLPVRVLSCPVKSSAQQRNAAAADARGEILAFLDDDIEFGPDLFVHMLAYFRTHQPSPGAIAARIPAEDRRRPGRLTRLYYRVQAGYSHPDFGGRLFGPGINCTPVYSPDTPELVPAQWLPATCLFVRANLFHAERFPAFAGYSFAEDVHLTARIARGAPLFFASRCVIEHHSLPSEFKRAPASLTAGKLHNMAIVAREAQRLHGWSLWWRWQLHRLFLTVTLVARRGPGWLQQLQGVLRASC